MNDKQFKDALTAAGMWFFLTQLEFVKYWNGDKEELIKKLYLSGFDSDISGTRTRVNSVIRIIEAGREKEALALIADSSIVNNVHPDAQSLAKIILSRL